MFVLNGYELSRFLGLSAATARDKTVMVTETLLVTHPIKEGHEGICSVAFDM